MLRNPSFWSENVWNIEIAAKVCPIGRPISYFGNLYPIVEFDVSFGWTGVWNMVRRRIMTIKSLVLTHNHSLFTGHHMLSLCSWSLSCRGSNRILSCRSCSRLRDRLLLLLPVLVRMYLLNQWQRQMTITWTQRWKVRQTGAQKIRTQWENCGSHSCDTMPSRSKQVWMSYPFVKILHPGRVRWVSHCSNHPFDLYVFIIYIYISSCTSYHSSPPGQGLG